MYNGFCYILLLQIIVIFLDRSSATTHSGHIVHDSVAPISKRNQKGIISASTKLPDWSDVKLDGTKRYVEILLAVDAAVSRFYGHDRDKIVAAMASLMHAVNLYTYQLGLNVIVVDVVAVRGYNLSLEQFLDWRQQQTGLAVHDVAMLVRHRYEGGIAYVNGACKRTSVGICGFFPEAPYEYASVFFHELAHLLGLSHDMTTDCVCSKENRRSCLRIDGFERDCSAQALVDLLPSLECLGPPRLPLPRTTLSLCGNGVVENDEDCDCGPEGYCDNVLCQARSCRFIIQRKYLYTTFTFGVAVTIGLFIIVAKRACIQRIGKRKVEKKFRPDIISSPTPLMHPDSFSPGTSPIKLKSTGTEPAIYPECAIQLPSIDQSIQPIRVAPKRPPQSLSLDQHVPLPSDEAVTPDYVRMHPAKIVGLKTDSVRLPCISPQKPRPEISDPIAVIVAGRPAAEYMAQEGQRTQSLGRQKKLNEAAAGNNTTLPRPLDRRTKPPLIGAPSSICPGDCPVSSIRGRMYDLPPLE